MAMFAVPACGRPPKANGCLWATVPIAKHAVTPRIVLGSATTGPVLSSSAGGAFAIANNVGVGGCGFVVLAIQVMLP